MCYKKRPFSETTVARASFPRVARSRGDSASTPARVRSANWYGLVAWAKTGAHAAASARETSRRNMPPVAMPHTLPPGLQIAVMRVKATPAATSYGTSACASKSAASVSSSTSSAWPNNPTILCSAPLGLRTARVHSLAWPRASCERPQ